MVEQLYKMKGKPVPEYSLRDYEDAVHSIVSKLQVGKDKPLKVVRGE